MGLWIIIWKTLQINKRIRKRADHPKHYMETVVFLRSRKNMLLSHIFSCWQILMTLVRYQICLYFLIYFLIVNHTVLILKRFSHLSKMSLNDTSMEAHKFHIKYDLSVSCFLFDVFMQV